MIASVSLFFLSLSLFLFTESKKFFENNTTDLLIERK